MIDKITVEDISLDIETGHTMYVKIDVFKFVKNEDYPWMEVYMEVDGGYEYLEEIEVDVISPKDLRKKAIKWLFEKVEILS